MTVTNATSEKHMCSVKWCKTQIRRYVLGNFYVLTE